MSPRLIIAIVSTLIYEFLLTALVVWGLPQLGVYIPLYGLILIMLAFGIMAIITYRKGTQALDRKVLNELPGMVGSRGRVVRLLEPQGMVKIKGEIWKAKSVGERINAGEEVVVIGQEKLKLIVKRLD